jgi:2-oxoglutarate ferredoxin oxidoreductase subunit beta
MNPLGEKYLRKDALPFLWCAGCGNGIILAAALRAIDELGIIDEIALVGGIGCSGWIPVYVDADTIHSLHGRAIAFATGLKMSDPHRKVIVFTGDGDCLGIGGNHFIHGARRNLDITVIMANNQIYGMTGGQVAPTTPAGGRTKTSFYGNPEGPFDACDLARSAGATYTARWTAAHPRQLAGSIKSAILHKGFAFIDVLTQCPTQAGRIIHRVSDPGKLLDLLKTQTVRADKAKGLEAGERGEKIAIGTLYEDRERPEFADTVYRMNARQIRSGN